MVHERAAAAAVGRHIVYCVVSGGEVSLDAIRSHYMRSNPAYTHHTIPQIKSKPSAPELVVHARKVGGVVEAPGADGVGPLRPALAVIVVVGAFFGGDEDGLELAERADVRGVVRRGGVGPAAGEGVGLYLFFGRVRGWGNDGSGVWNDHVYM